LIITEYLEFIQKNKENFFDEYKKIKQCINEFNYTLNEDDVTTIYTNLIDYKYIDLNKINIISQDVDGRIEEYKY
jgi:hypothetical protein